MNSNITIVGANRDQMPLEELAQQWKTQSWALFVRRVQAMIVEQQRIVETSAIQIETLRAQGQIAALRRVLDIPNILAKELAKQGAK